MTIGTSAITSKTAFDVNAFLERNGRALEKEFKPSISLEANGHQMTYFLATSVINTMSDVLFGRGLTHDQILNEFATISKSENYEPQDFENEVRNVAVYCHHLALQALYSGTGVSEEQVNAVRRAFMDLSECYKKLPSRGTEVYRLVQLSEASPLLARCSEAFARHLASFENKLAELFKQMQMKPENKAAFTVALMRCRRSLFPEQLCTREVKKAFDDGEEIPGINHLSLKDAVLANAKGFLALGIAALNDNADLKLVQEHLGALKSKLEYHQGLAQKGDQIQELEKMVESERVRLQSLFELLIDCEQKLAKAKANDEGANTTAGADLEHRISELHTNIEDLEKGISGQEEQIRSLKSELAADKLLSAAEMKELRKLVERYRPLAAFPKAVLSCAKLYAQHFNDRVSHLPEESTAEQGEESQASMTAESDEAPATSETEAASSGGSSSNWFWSLLGY